MDIPQLSAWVRDIKSGNTFCTSCRKLQCDKPKCIDCYMAKKDFKWCIECGDKIKDSRLSYYKSKGWNCTTCMPCKRGYREVCEKCGVKHPREWHITPPTNDQ